MVLRRSRRGGSIEQLYKGAGSVRRGGEMETVGNYKIVRQLKIDGPGGGMSKLYIAYRRGPDELEGLQSKVLLKHQAVTSPELVDHFLMEARLGLKLVHPNIARVTDVFKDAGQLW